MTVTLRQLRAYVAVAETGSFTAGAARLSLTPSALSLLVKDLETAVGVRLLERSTRHTALTVAGTDFLPLARKVLEDLERALASAKELQQKKRGVVRVACTPLYAAVVIPKLIAAHRRRYPAVEILVLDSLHQQALQRVAIGEADFGIAPQRATPPELQQERVSEDRMVLFCPPDHPFAKRRNITWAQALEQPFVTLTEDFTARLQADLLRHSKELQLNARHQVSLVTTALGMVKCGAGITAQPSCAVPLAESFGLVTRRLHEPIVSRQLSIYTKKDTTLSPAAESFRELVVKQLAG